MTFVEWLRVRGTLKWTAIVFGVLFLCAIGLRVYMFSRGDIMAYVSGIENDPGATVTQSVLPDGTKRTSIEDMRKNTVVTIDDRGYDGKHIEILNRSGHRAPTEHSVAMGSMQVHALRSGEGERIEIDTNQPEPFAFYAAFAAFVALIVATILAAPFARENDGHLEIALTKPVPRVLLAVSTIGVDFAGIVAAWLLSVVFLLAAGALFELPKLQFGQDDLLGTILGLLGAFAWYAMLCAGTASMRRGYGVVLGLAWPFALLVLALGNIDLGSQPIGLAIHTVAKAVGYVMPFTYLHFGAPVVVNGQAQGSAAFSPGVELPVLAALLAGYAALAIVQWRRVEA